MMTMRGLSLFSGILPPGLDLAFECAGGEISAFCEIEPYCQKVLRKHWPNVPVFEDIRELRGSDVGAVDVIYGGFLCQPFSVAGNKKGKDDSRYLWPEFSRLVGEIRPRWIVAENVPGILRIAADDVCADLERQGYSVGIWDFEAEAVGAKHRRECIFFVVHRLFVSHCYRGASSKERYEMKIKKGLPICLNDQVAHMLPTPLAHDAKNISAGDYKRHTPPLGCLAGGSLNPEWIEWLMGFPIGWTDLKHSETL